MKLQYKILQFFPIFLFYFPTIRLGGIPLRFEDFLCLALFLNLIMISRIRINKDYLTFVLIYFTMVLCLIISSLLYIDVLNYKSLIVGLSYAKYLMWFLIVYRLNEYEHFERYKKVFFSVLKFCFLLQIMILIFQKFDVLGFASGTPFYFVVKFYSIPNIYATSTDLESLISIHMNFRFRPAGTFGSSTVTGLAMYIIGSLLYRHTGNTIYKLLAYFSALICFAKIAIVAAIFCDFLLPILFRFRLKSLVYSLVMLPFLMLVIYFSMDALGVMHNFQGAIGGTDRGVTHRLNVVNYMLGMSFFELFFGNLGVLPFGFFDSGTLLSIFRYGFIFYVLELSLIHI